MMAVLSSVIGGYLYYSALEGSSLESEHKEAVEHLKVLRNDIDSYLTWFLLSAKSLAGLKELKQSLLTGDRVVLAEANAILDHFRDALKASVCYLMDRSGNTIASSNRDAPDSFVGKNYGFRPYYKQAMRGTPTVYMALGVTSKKRGIYYSHPVFEKGQEEPLGVAVIKASIQEIKKNLMESYDGILLLTDPHGVVFISSRADWLYHVLWKVSSEKISDITKTRQFGKGPWNWTGMKMVDKDNAMDNLGSEYRVHQQELSNYPGWHLVYLLSHHEVSKKIIAPLRKSVGSSIVALCVFIGLIVFFFYIKANTSIIQRKKAEESLRDSEERYRNVYSTAPLAFVMWDHELRITDWNEQAEKMFGWSRKEVLGHNFFEFLIPERARSQVEAVVDLLLQGELPSHSINENLTQKGATILVEWNNSILFDNEGHVMGAISLGLDITERKRAEKTLRKYERIVASSNDHMALLDRNYVYQTVNDAYLQSMDKKREDIVGHSVSELFGQEFFEKNQKSNIDRCLAGEIVRYHRWINFPGTGQRYMDVVHYPYYEDGDSISGYVVNARDITEQKELENQLQQAQKMESIGTLAGGIAHDFNNILSPILGHSELAMMELPPDSQVQRNLRYIFEAGKRARDLVKQILTFARRREENRIPLKTSLIMEDAIKFLRSTIPSTIDIQYDFKTEQDTVLSDPTQMNQIVMNLCTNATHAMQEKGGVLAISLSDEYIGSDEINQFTGLTPGHYLKLSVSDTGSGISTDIMDKIFEPYFTTKGPGEGTGMGLAVIHGIVKNYEGDIAVESEIGKGTTFHVLLPIVDTEVSLTVEPKFELPGGEERILCVDDEKAAVDTIQLMLERLGYKVTARTSSIEALEAFRNNPNRFDLVITDQTMPNMTGKELAKELMSIRSDIPIILCTGFSEQIDERSAKERGISAFVMKPIVMRQIARTIREVLDKTQ
jgi:PAS domain S-box-containing protein